MSAETSVLWRGGLALAALVAVALTGLAGCDRSKSVAAEPQGTSNSAASASAPTLDPQLFTGRVREAYKIARQDPALLASLHCYCGCDREEGHRNLLDCYRTEHGSQCPICVGEVLDAERMASMGASIEQIRDALRAHYEH